ncbi:MAG: hypothetical protein HQM10_18905 [Candidatus Riflebacteria bacterium]|nr:hypothetical protein [Candidatus Riflebacteria bacterium]
MKCCSKKKIMFLFLFLFLFLLNIQNAISSPFGSDSVTIAPTGTLKVGLFNSGITEKQAWGKVQIFCKNNRIAYTKDIDQATWLYNTYITYKVDRFALGSAQTRLMEEEKRGNAEAIKSAQQSVMKAYKPFLPVPLYLIEDHHKKMRNFCLKEKIVYFENKQQKDWFELIYSQDSLNRNRYKIQYDKLLFLYKIDTDKTVGAKYDKLRYEIMAQEKKVVDEYKKSFIQVPSYYLR